MADVGAEGAQGGEAEALLRRECGFGDDEEAPLVWFAVVGGGVGAGMPGEDEQVGVAATLLGPAAVVLKTAGLVGDGELTARGGGVGSVPALPRRRLLDLHPQARGRMDEVAGAPVARAQLPVGLERHSHDLLHQFSARRVADDGGAVEALSQALD